MAAGGAASVVVVLMWVIAHRGASAEQRENTPAAFERAIELGADFVELDVQASRDGGLVVFHDLRLDRLTVARGPLRARPLAELRELGIPTLEEVLELTSGRIPAMVEIKHPWLYRRHDIVRRTVELVRRDDWILSFSRRAVLESRRLRPDLRTMQHVGRGVPIRLAQGARAAGFDDDLVTPRGLAAAQRLGLETAVFTVNDEARVLELRDLGVTGVFTDYPDRAREALTRRRD